MKKILTLLLCITILTPLLQLDIHASNDDFSDYIKSAIAFLKNSNSGSSFYTSAFNTAQFIVPSDMAEQIQADIRQNTSSDEKISATTYAKAIIDLSILDIDPQNYNNYNLVDTLANFRDISSQGANAPAFALIALDIRDYPVDESAINTRKNLIAEIIGFQNPDGGFPLFKNNESEVDTTSFALIALAPYIGQAGVNNTVKQGFDYLKLAQMFDSSFAGNNGDSCESACSVAMALNTYADSLSTFGTTIFDFTKNNTSIYEYILSFQNQDGGFAHLKNGTSSAMTTEQAIMALSKLPPFKLYVAGIDTFHYISTQIWSFFGLFVMVLAVIFLCIFVTRFIGKKFPNLLKEKDSENPADQEKIKEEIGDDENENDM